MGKNHFYFLIFLQSYEMTMADLANSRCMHWYCKRKLVVDQRFMFPYTNQGVG